MNYKEYMMLAEEGMEAMAKAVYGSAAEEPGGSHITKLELLGRGFAILGALPFAVAGYVARKVGKA